MDEESADSIPGPFGLKSTAAKQKKKVVPSKEKTDKAEAASTGQSKEKKTTLDLVCEAIEAAGESRKGASAQIIKRYVKSQLNSERAVNTLVNKALIKGVEKGKLERPPHSKNATGAIGFFRLAKVEAPKRNLKPKPQEQAASDSEATEKPIKPRKRNLSDTYIQEMRSASTSTPKPSVKVAATLKETANSKDAKKTKKVPLKKKTNAKKDTSDTKIVVKKTQPKSTKSYSSDTEVDVAQKKKTKTDKEPLKKAKADKPKTQKAELESKASNTKTKKLYNSAEEKENKANTKSTNTKTKAKKQ